MTMVKIEIILISADKMSRGACVLHRLCASVTRQLIIPKLKLRQLAEHCEATWNISYVALFKFIN